MEQLSTRVLLVGEGSHSHELFLHRLAAGLSAEDLITETRVIGAPGRLQARLIASLPAIGAYDLHTLRWRLNYSWRARRALAGSQQADVVLINTQSCALLAAAAMARAPTVISVDATGRQFAALEYWRPRGRGSVLSEAPLERLERRALHRATKVLAWTDWTARSLRDDYGLADEQIAVVHPGVDGAWWQLERPARQRDGLQILFVGDDVARKGLPVLMQALPLVERPLELHIVSRAEGLSDEANVIVHDDLPAHGDAVRQRFAEADVLVLPTLADAAPWVVVEAMASGLPVVASDVSAIPELLGDTGIVVPRGDVPALAAALRRLADQPAYRDTLGARARARAREHYGGGRQLGRIAEILREARGGVRV